MAVEKISFQEWLAARLIYLCFYRFNLLGSFETESNFVDQFNAREEIENGLHCRAKKKRKQRKKRGGKKIGEKKKIKRGYRRS